MKKGIVSILICMSVYAQEQQQASKGACIEATFIIQNKHNVLLEHMQKVKKELEQAHLMRKKLVQERQPLIEKYQKLKQDYNKTLQQKESRTKSQKLVLLREQKQELASLLSMLNRELGYATLVEELYPDYSKELDLLSLGLSKFIGDLVEAECVLSGDIEKEVQKAFTIRDKVELEAQVVDLFFELDKQKVTLKNKERTLPYKEHKLQELQQGEPSKKKEEILAALKREIAYLKSTSTRLKRSILSKQKALEGFRRKALAIHASLYKDKKMLPFVEKLLSWKS